MPAVLHKAAIAAAAFAFAAGDLATLSLSPAPAEARWRHGGYRHHPYHPYHHGRVDAGDVIAGIIIVAGVAAIASAASGADEDRWRDRRSQRDDFAVDECRLEAERQARAYGAYAIVRDIYAVDRRSGSVRVKGLVEIATSHEVPGGTDRRIATERFTCLIRDGRVASYGLGISDGVAFRD
jgi:hypothetical protein